MTKDLKKLKIAIIGNPNCGKSTIFNLLTGSNQKIGNWSGVTVESKRGFFECANHEIELIDLPGIYSISQNLASSIDEKIARDFLLSQEYDLVLNVLDASNLSRHLYLSVQLLEMGVKTFAVLNMCDVAEGKGIEISEKKLLENVDFLGVSKTTARTKDGIDDLVKKITACAQKSTASKPQKIHLSHYPDILRNAISKIASQISSQSSHREYLAITELEKMSDGNQKQIDVKVQATTCDLRQQIEKKFDEDIDILIAGFRYDFIANICTKAITKKEVEASPLSEKLDAIFLNKYFGVPIFFFLMYMMFAFSIVVGGVFEAPFEIVGTSIFVKGSAHLLSLINAPDMAIEIISGGIGGGIASVVLPFIPIIWAMYIFLSLLEDSGYMARAAFIMDKMMRSFGLPGKSIVPLIVGFGCNVPSVMGARTLENHSDRFTTIMMAPFMSCTARLTVYVLFCSVFFAQSSQNIVFALYIIGIAAALITGFLLKLTVLKGEPSYFVMEMPNYNTPTISNILKKANDRVRSFAYRAGKYIILAFVILHILGIKYNESSQSPLVSIGKAITPAFAPMGITEENWPATIGLFSGIFAKEVVVGTLSAIYANKDEEEDEPWSFKEDLLEALSVIREDLLGSYHRLTNPLFLNVLGEDATEQIEEEGFDAEVAKSMYSKFDGKVGAFAYMLFILLYFPCVSVFGAMVRELGARWALFSAIWSTCLAYSVATLFYQFSKMAEGQAYSLSYIILAIALTASNILYLYFKSCYSDKVPATS